MIRIFTTEYTEFHGGKMIFVQKTPCTPWLIFLGRIFLGENFS